MERNRKARGRKEETEMRGRKGKKINGIRINEKKESKKRKGKEERKKAI